jgi:hypothetical protein
VETLPDGLPRIEISADRSTYTQSPSLLGCDFLIKNSGTGTASDFQIAGIDLKGASGTFGFSTPRRATIDVGQTQRFSVTVNRNNSLPILTLNMSLRYSYRSPEGALVTGNSPWIRVK